MDIKLLKKAILDDDTTNSCVIIIIVLGVGLYNYFKGNVLFYKVIVLVLASFIFPILMTILNYFHFKRLTDNGTIDDEPIEEKQEKWKKSKSIDATPYIRPAFEKSFEYDSSNIVNYPEDGNFTLLEIYKSPSSKDLIQEVNTLLAEAEIFDDHSKVEQAQQLVQKKIIIFERALSIMINPKTKQPINYFIHKEGHAFLYSSFSKSVPMWFVETFEEVLSNKFEKEHQSKNAGKENKEHNDYNKKSNNTQDKQEENNQENTQREENDPANIINYRKETSFCLLDIYNKSTDFRSLIRQINELQASNLDNNTKKQQTIELISQYQSRFEKAVLILIDPHDKKHVNYYINKDRKAKLYSNFARDVPLWFVEKFEEILTINFRRNYSSNNREAGYKNKTQGRGAERQTYQNYTKEETQGESDTKKEQAQQENDPNNIINYEIDTSFYLLDLYKSTDFKNLIKQLNELQSSNLDNETKKEFTNSLINKYESSFQKAIELMINSETKEPVNYYINKDRKAKLYPSFARDVPLWFVEKCEELLTKDFNDKSSGNSRQTEQEDKQDTSTEQEEAGTDNRKSEETETNNEQEKPNWGFNGNAGDSQKRRRGRPKK